jgi:hypothetical protein
MIYAGTTTEALHISRAPIGGSVRLSRVEGRSRGVAGAGLSLAGVIGDGWVVRVRCGIHRVNLARPSVAIPTKIPTTALSAAAEPASRWTTLDHQPGHGEQNVPQDDWRAAGGGAPVSDVVLDLPGQ